MGSDGTLASAIGVGLVYDLAFSAARNSLYFADNTNCAVRRIDLATNQTYSVAGNGNSYTDGAAANRSTLTYAYGLALDAAHTKLYISEGGAGINRVSVVDLDTGNISKVAGNTVILPNMGDGGPATSATLYNPKHITVDKQGRVFIADQVGV